MYHTYKYLWILSLLLIVGIRLYAQDNDPRDGDPRDGDPRDSDPREYLMDKLKIYYVEAPNDTLGEYYLLKNKEIAENDTCSYCGDFWTSLMMVEAKALVRGLFGTPENGGDLALQRYAKEICQILDAPLEVWLYNDIDSLNALAKKNYNPCIDSDGYVWPCASTLDDEDDEFGEWAGYMHLGGFNMGEHGVEWTKATFLHELMHTQDQSDLRAHIFYSYEAGKSYHYGADGKHFVAEAIPSLRSAYKEGIANTISMLYDAKESLRTFTWFANNDYLLVETAYDAKATDIPAKAWLYNRIRAATGKDGDQLPKAEFSKSTVENYKGYHIQDLPPKFIIHNEMIIALIFSNYVERVNLDTFIDALIKTNYSDPSMSPLAQIFKNLCEAGLPEDKTVLTVRDLPMGTPKTHLLPLAYADYLTGYNAKDKQKFSEIFEEELPQSWIDLYWDTAKKDVRHAVPLDKEVSYKDLESVARALDIYPEGTP